MYWRPLIVDSKQFEHFAWRKCAPHSRQQAHTHTEGRRAWHSRTLAAGVMLFSAASCVSGWRAVHCTRAWVEHVRGWTGSAESRISLSFFLCHRSTLRTHGSRHKEQHAEAKKQEGKWRHKGTRRRRRGVIAAATASWKQTAPCDPGPDPLCVQALCSRMGRRGGVFWWALPNRLGSRLFLCVAASRLI
jgi:hypothetical protein